MPVLHPDIRGRRTSFGVLNRNAADITWFGPFQPDMPLAGLRVPAGPQPTIRPRLQWVAVQIPAFGTRPPAHCRKIGQVYRPLGINANMLMMKRSHRASFAI
jgi:hypothetical protein